MNKKKIAVFSTCWTSDILYQFLLGATDGFKRISADIYLFTCNAIFDNSKKYMASEFNIFNLPKLEDFDAAVIFGNSIEYQNIIDSVCDKAKEANIPAVITGRNNPYCYFVGSENESGTRELCEHLISVHNVKSAYFIAGIEDNMDSISRLNTTRKVFNEHNLILPEENICYSKWDPRLAVGFILNKLDKEPLPDAIICANDTLAMAICSYLRGKNIYVPRDVIVTGFNNEPFAQTYDPSICSVDQNFEQIGYAVSTILLDIFSGRSVPKAQMINCSFVASESCGCTSAKDFDAIRRGIGRNHFESNIRNSNYDRKLSLLEKSIMKGKKYKDIIDNLYYVHQKYSMYEGDCFHILLDPLFEKTTTDSNVKLLATGYSQKMDVVYSKCFDKVTHFSDFDIKQLVPQITDPEINHFYIFLPLHDSDGVLGYMIFADDIEKVKHGSLLRKYTERFSIILSKHLGDLRVASLNNKLLQMARTDVLTGAYNRTAYEEVELVLRKKIADDKQSKFSIVVFDINNLKKINDAQGHEAGDVYIINSCQIIKEHFGNHNVYRIGGDEFVAILEDDSFDNRHKLMDAFQEHLEQIKESDLSVCEKVSIASGMATYDPEKDLFFNTVFSRADSRMYENKMRMKEKPLNQ